MTIWAFFWETFADSPGTEPSPFLSCARIYAESAGILSAADLLVMPEPVVIRGEKGKPYFDSEVVGQNDQQPRWSDIHFSLSHSGDYSACAFHTKPVGLDLQVHRECRREAIARRFFHPAEYAWLEKTGFEAFFQVWAAKESYVKYTGSGIAGGLDTFSVVDENGLVRDLPREDGSPGVSLWTPGERHSRSLSCDPVEPPPLWLPENYSFCLCAESIPDVRLVFYAEKP